MAKILIIEDDEGLIYRIQKLLKSEDYEVKLCNSMKSVYDLFDTVFDTNLFDLLIIDLALPESESDYNQIMEINKLMADTTTKMISEADPIKLQELRMKRQTQYFAKNSLLLQEGGKILIQTLKEKKKISNQTAVIYLSASGNEILSKECLAELKNSMWFTKPISSEILIRSIKDLLESSAPNAHSNLN
jgi:DNA-binding response OmpR family regulator